MTTVPVLLVRFLPGYVGESRRVVHVVPVVNTAEVPSMLVAYCGQPIERGTAEVLPEIGGMPCTRCVLATPSPTGARATAGTPRGTPSASWRSRLLRPTSDMPTAMQ